MSKKAKIAGSVVAILFIDAFASRWIDKVLSYPFPVDIIMLLVITAILFFIAYKIAGDLLRE